MAKGDLILTVLDSRPRTLLCLERLLEDSPKGASDFVVGGRADYFDSLLFVPAVEKRLGRRLPGAPATLPDTLADELVAAMAAELKKPMPLVVKEGAPLRQYVQASFLRPPGYCAEDVLGEMPVL
jgi:hypothetical protein